MEVAIEEDAEEKNKDTQSHLPVVIKQRTGNKMAEAPQVEYQEDDDQIHENEDGGCTYLVGSLSHRQGIAVELSSEVHKQHGETEDASEDNERFP
jgi:hypothetical protein